MTACLCVPYHCLACCHARTLNIMREGKKAEMPPHGTYARYQLEINAYQGESCAACRTAVRVYRDKCAPGLGWPLRSS